MSQEKDHADLAEIKTHKVNVTSIQIQSVWDKHIYLGRISGFKQLEQHAARALGNIKAARIPATLSIFTSFLSVILLIFFLVLGRNINLYFERLGSSQSISIFLKDDVANAEVDSILKILSARSEIGKAEYISKQQALEQFRISLGKNASILQGLEQANPLPPSVQVSIKAQALRGVELDRLVSEIQQLRGVDQVQYSSGIFKEFSSFFSFIERGGLVAVLMMLLVTTIIISNTIHMAVYSHRDEIRIMRLLGASPSYIRSPFLVEGAIVGFVGSLCAVIISWAAFKFLLGAWPKVLTLSSLFPEPIFVASWVVFAIILLGIFVGVIGGIWGSRVYRSL